MDHNESRGLLKTILGFLARRTPEKSTPPTSLKSQALDAWVRTDAYLQHNADDFDEIDPERVASSLKTFENLVQYESNPEPGSDVHHDMPYPKLQAVRQMVEDPNHRAHFNLGTSIRISKRKRDSSAVIDELSHIDMDAKRRRVLHREEPDNGGGSEDPDADFAMLMRKHSVLLHQGLRTQWTCVCQNCSGLSVRLSLPQRKKDSKFESCFEVFFGVRSLLAITLQEAKITVKAIQKDKNMGSSELVANVMPEFAHICQCITESLNQQNCLHLLLEDGLFKRLRPQPKTFGNSQLPRTVFLSALFKRQQELRGGSSVLPLKGKRILAVTLATALIPFLETPWIQPSFNHSKIQFFQPLQGGQLPDITKPFLSMEHVPYISANKVDTGNDQTSYFSSKHMVHPNASVLALGILLCELHYCTPVETWQNDPEAARNANTDYYTSLEILKNLEADAGVDYYLAVKACLQWEYYPAGELADFESDTVQRLFYQNVVKRLESEIFKSWRLRLEDLARLDSRENELCWGLIGREVVRPQTSHPELSTRGNRELEVPLRPASRHASFSHSSNNTSMLQPVLTDHSSFSQNRRLSLSDASNQSLYLFDASHQVVPDQSTELSEKWMNGLLSSIYHHVDPYDNFIQSSAIRTTTTFQPVKIAILDSGFNPGNPLLLTDTGQLDPRIKGVRNFVDHTNPDDIQDDIGHGTHTLGLLLKVATCADIYIARIASGDCLTRNSYESIAKAINHAVTEWNVDIISMSFGIREYNEPMKTAVSNALHNQSLMFAAASNDGANLGRAFPAKYPSVFCIHSTDGNGNPSAFNPTADEKDVNFSLLGEHVDSHWPAGKGGHNDIVNVLSGTSVATPIAAGLAASVLSFVRQQEQHMAPGSDFLGPWLKDVHSMDAVLKSMVRQRRGTGYDYITPHLLFDMGSSREQVYYKIKDIKKHMYH